MEKLKEKHNHSLTNILKVLTFAIVLLFPFLVFMPTSFFYGFNEHAQVEIPQKTAKYQTNELMEPTDFVNGNIYKIDYEDNASQQSLQEFLNAQGGIYIQYIYYEDNLYNTFVQFYDKDSETIALWFNRSNNMLQVSNDSDFPVLEIQADYLYIVSDYWTEYAEEMWNNYVGIHKSDYNVYEISETTTISENLSNSWENMWQTPLFKWTENTPFTATTNAFASVFNISQESGFYNLIAYFITITGIYLIIDIVLGVATWLTHMIGRQD